MTPTIVKQLVIGMPRTGKTTFIAALGHVVDSGEVPEALRLIEMNGVQDHLNAIMKEWVGYRQFGRTGVGAEKILTMKLATREGNYIAQVTFPDMAGESFENQWKTRQWTVEYDEMAREATGILLFVHPNRIIEPIEIESVDELAREVSESSSDVPEEHDASEEEFVEDATDAAHQDARNPWSLDMVPTGVQLVDLLQFFTLQPQIYPLTRIAVIVSAWDTVMNVFSNPAQWLVSGLPLLDQFLKTNHTRVSHRVYGISAFGCDPDDEEKLAHLQRQHSEPSQRVIVAGHECAPHDITAPIKWLMGVS